MKQNYLSKFVAWQKLLCGERIAAIRLSERGWNYLRREASRIGRKLVDDGSGAYKTYSLS
jgi:hypothetical protein